MENPTPKDLAYFFPPEWHQHKATWLSYPHNESSFPERLNEIYKPFFSFVKVLSQYEKVYINAGKLDLIPRIAKQLEIFEIPPEKVKILPHPTNDAWCRDHGGAFLINKNPTIEKPKAIVNWKYNAWGEKYSYDLDNNIPLLMGDFLQLPVFNPNIVMEGGAVDFNGAGTVLTTESCLLNKNRNPHLSKKQIEKYLFEYYGLEQVFWLKEGIMGDDTDGHIDDLTRFVAEDKVITMIEANKSDVNYLVLKENLKLLKSFRFLNHKPLEVIELPMPEAVIWKGERLPASYANFYIANKVVIVPTFYSKNDIIALETLQKCFPEREIVGIDATALIWGLGTFHCLSQQEPEPLLFLTYL